jgi:formylglycine-generating enzyme required for sulfatase activity
MRDRCPPEIRARRGSALVLALALAPALSACRGDLGENGDEGEGGGAGAPATSSAGTSTGSGEGGAGEGGAGEIVGGAAWRTLGGGCPLDMVRVEGACVDRFEAPNVRGARPLVMQSAVTAEAWCAERDKRLCTEDEWDLACQGPSGQTYPYGDAHEDGRCNDDKTWIAPDEGTLATWPSAEAQAEVDALYQAAPSGDLAGCVSEGGVFDLTGNVEEWVVRTREHPNDYPHVLKGCYWSGCYGGSKPTCLSTNPAHADGFMFYETGFRCCRDPS